LDGTDRVVRDSGEARPVKISREEVEAAMERIRTMNAKQELENVKKSSGPISFPK